MLLLLTALMAAHPAVLPVAADSGRTINGVTLPDTREVAGHTLHFNGAALRTKYFIKAKVYVGALYLAQPSTKAADILAADAARQMEMHFVRDVGKDKICEAWDEGLESNTPDASSDIKQQFKQLCDYMADIKDGEAFVFTYLPGTGTTIEVAGETKGTIAGKEFADAMLRTWIGPKPGPGNGFKKDILGGK